MVTSMEKDHNYGSKFLGYTTIDDAIAKTRKVWSALWEQLGDDKPWFILYRNPYYPENQTERRFNRYSLSQAVEGKDGLPKLLDQFAMTRTLSLPRSTGRPYYISGIVHLKSGEMAEVNIASSQPVGNVWPEYLKPTFVRAWIHHYLPSNEGVQARINPQELVLASR